MADTSNTASDWHQVAIYKLADWTKLRVLILLFFSIVLYKKKIKILHKSYFTISEMKPVW